VFTIDKLGSAAVAVGLAAALSGCGGFASAAGHSPGTVRASFGATKPLPANYFGINYDYGGASSYRADSSVDGQLAALAPGTLRWPAGTGANYFQWQQGYPVAVPPTGGTGKCTPPPEGEVDGEQFTLADLAAAYRATRAIPIFDLNVMSASLADQITMLRTAANTDKVPVKYVELGNEFYLCNSDYVHAFPTAQSYGATVAADVRELHDDFPGVLVAAVGAQPSKNARADTWTSGVLSAATGAGRPDAITLHDHPEYNQSLTISGLPALFTEPYTSAANLDDATKQPDLAGMPVWITEYSLSLHWTQGTPAQRTYANALFESTAALLLARTVPTVALVDYWSAFGPENSYAETGTDPTTQTPVGLAMAWLDQAARGATSETPIDFAGVPTLGGSGDPAVLGTSFGTGHGTLLINLAGRTVTVAPGSTIRPGSSYQQVIGDPTAEISDGSTLRSSHGTVGTSLALGPYSMTLIS
jgi:hypothetical protein